MKLNSINIKDFRRFTDLTVEKIPESAQLIILAGPNGCGKSSFIDALIAWHASEYVKKHRQWRNFSWESDYHKKVDAKPAANWQNKINLLPFGSVPPEIGKAVYVRSAYRNDPEFQMQQLSRVGNPFESLPVTRTINNDAAVSKNFQRLVSQSVEGIFVPEDGSITLEEFAEKVLGDIRRSISILFQPWNFTASEILLWTAPSVLLRELVLDSCTKIFLEARRRLLTLFSIWSLLVAHSTIHYSVSTNQNLI